MNSGQSLEEKQQYLRQNILQKNYDVEEFIQYLNEKLQVNSDIEKCSQKDLERVVQSFIKKVKKAEVHTSEMGSEQCRGSMISSMGSSTFSGFGTSSTISRPRKNIKISAEPLVVQEEFQQTFKCIRTHEKITQEDIKKKKIFCLVHSPERKYVSTVLGFSSSSYLEFKISTYGLGWQVGRRYSDFIWLRGVLRKFYPSQIIPPIPNKKAHKKTPRHLKKRMAILTILLNDLMSYPEFINSVYLQAFLSYPSKKFQVFKKQTDNRKAYESITTTETLSGEISIGINKNTLSFTDRIPNWIQQSEVLLKELTRHSKYLQANTIEQVNTLFDMGEKFSELYQISDRLHQAETTKKDSKNEDFSQQESQGKGFSGMHKMKEIFTTLNNMMVQWGDILNKQVDLIEDNCNVLYKYVRQSLTGFRELSAVKEEAKKTFIEAKVELEKKKSKIFELNDVHKWDLPKSELAYVPKSALYSKPEAFKLMLPKESANLEKLKQNYAYFVTQLYENSDSYLRRMAAKICRNFQEFTIKSKVSNQQLGGLWSQMAYNFTQAFGNNGFKKKQMQLKSHEKIKKKLEEDMCFEGSSQMQSSEALLKSDK